MGTSNNWSSCAFPNILEVNDFAQMFQGKNTLRLPRVLLVARIPLPSDTVLSSKLLALNTFMLWG